MLFLSHLSLGDDLLTCTGLRLLLGHQLHELTPHKRVSSKGFVSNCKNVDFPTVASVVLDVLNLLYTRRMLKDQKCKAR